MVTVLPSYFSQSNKPRVFSHRRGYGHEVPIPYRYRSSAGESPPANRERGRHNSLLHRQWVYWVTVVLILVGKERPIFITQCSGRTSLNELLTCMLPTVCARGAFASGEAFCKYLSDSRFTIYTHLGNQGCFTPNQIRRNFLIRNVLVIVSCWIKGSYCFANKFELKFTFYVREYSRVDIYYKSKIKRDESRKLIR